ncbi:MAG: hypothetical protein L3J81_02625, partial [Thermoplasmata archaeon]|nr:hypothetical protein [Thermoplasmata archaeon]
MDPSPTAPSETLLPAERCPDLASLDELRLRGLSEFFDPFLGAFARDTLRTGGEVWVSRSGDSVDGLYLYLESERQGAVFTHSRPIAESFSARHSGSSTYSDFPLGTRSELFRIYEGTATGPDPSHRFRHPVRAGGDADRLEVLGLMRGVHGVVDDAWFTSIARENEVCFVVEGDRELAGVG